MMDLFSNPMLLVTRLIAVVVALSFHEWAHAFAAYKLGDPTAKNMGRMTIDPLKHIDPIGFVFMMLFRFGWAKPVPINPNNFKKPKRDDIIVSLAGVTANFCLAFATIFLVTLIDKFFPIENAVVWEFVSQFFFLNISLMIFNLLPIPPLDGYHVFKNLLLGKININFFWKYERYGTFILWGLILFNFTSYIMVPMVNGITTFIFTIIEFIL